MPCLLLIFLGWGIDDRCGFLASPARAAFLFIILIAASAALVLRLDVDPSRKGTNPNGGQTLQLALLILASLALLGFLPFADRRNILTFRSGSWRYLGLSLFCAGAATRLLALKSLGTHFSAYVTLQPGHRLIRDGVYRRIRHPLYLSLLLSPAGVALVFGSWLTAPIFVLAAIFVADRIRQEDCLLAAHFGPEFENYKRSARMLLPGLL